MKKFLLILACLVLLTETRASAAEDWAFRVISSCVDIFIARPFTFAATAVGGGVWTAALPITLPTRTAKDSFEILIQAPWQYTFDRPLGDFQE